MPKQINLFRGDCLRLLESLPDNSVDLVVTDPPYYKVKTNAWDNQWDSVEEFLAWMDAILAQVWRVLKPSGSLYLFCSPGLSAETEMLIKQRFNVLNSIIWRKENGRHKGTCKATLRRYFPQTERIVFAEHYGAEGKAKGDAGYARKCAELKANVFRPLIEYFAQARAISGITNKEINQAVGNQMAGHWFTDTQWQLPSAEQYAVLQQLFSARAQTLDKPHAALAAEHAQLWRQYVELRTEYDDLRQQYEALRRPFSVDAEVPYTDVWDFAAVQYRASVWKHPCEKPMELARHIIEVSSRPGAVVLDAFMGSGAFGQAAVELGRCFIGAEFEDDTFERAEARIHAALPLQNDKAS